MIFRDRGGAVTGRPGSCAGAVQVADRFHLWQDLAETVEKTVLTCLAALSSPPSRPQDPQAVVVPSRPGPAPADAASAEPDGSRDVHGHERRLVAPHRERCAAGQGASGRGLPGPGDRAPPGPARGTAARFASAGSIDELLVKATSRASILDPFKPYPGQRWNEGITSAAALHQ